jgi:hypothetical protein
MTYILDVFNVLKSSSLQGRLFLEKARSHSEPRKGVPFQQSILCQKLPGREHLVSWSIVMV